MKRLAVDMDDVLADTLGALLEWLRVTYRYPWTPADVCGKEIENLLRAEHLAALRAMMQEGSIFGSLSVIPGAQRVMKALQQRYELFVASAAMEFPRSCIAKYEWMQRHFPFVSPSHIVFCGDKSIVNAGYLIDDSSRHFERFKGQGILFTSPPNVNETGYTRADSWDDVERLFLSGDSIPRPLRTFPEPAAGRVG